MNKKKYLIGGLILIVALIFLGYLGFMGGLTYYYEVSELLDETSSITGQTVRVSGNVADDVVKDGLEVRFTILDMSDSETSLQVIYNGAVPDTFKVGNQVVVEGKYTAGIFEAEAIIIKCGSKYIPEE
ncbi:MAG: cytochrome c maturation protein CcmE [Chloroflexota bacterium]